MRLSAYDLKQDFLAHIRRTIQTNVTMQTQHDRYNVTVQKSYLGAGNVDDLKKASAWNDVEMHTLNPGNVYFTDREICTFLNTAWEQLHLAKCKTLQDMLMSKEVTSSQMESALYEHDQLYQSTNPLDELQHTDTWLKNNFVDLTTNQSRIFLIPDNICNYGPPVIVSCVIHEYKAQTVGMNIPQNSRVCRAISPNEIGGLINLATNSRYTSGSLFRRRKFVYDGVVKDVIEVFHMDESSTGSILPWAKGGAKLVMGFVMHPKPIEPIEVNEPDSEKEEEVKKGSTWKFWADEPKPAMVSTTGFRLIECAYPEEIALTAATLALGGMK